MGSLKAKQRNSSRTGVNASCLESQEEREIEQRRRMGQVCRKGGREGRKVIQGKEVARKEGMKGVVPWTDGGKGGEGMEVIRRRQGQERAVEGM